MGTADRVLPVQQNTPAANASAVATRGGNEVRSVVGTMRELSAWVARFKQDTDTRAQRKAPVQSAPAAAQVQVPAPPPQRPRGPALPRNGALDHGQWKAV